MKKVISFVAVACMLISLAACGSTTAEAESEDTTAVSTATEEATSTQGISMATAAQMAACDYVGIASGNNTADKMEKAGFHTVKAEFVDAPIIEELPMTLECKRYDSETCHLFGEIVNVSADERILTDGKIDIRKLAPITFDPVGGTYHVVGEQVGRAFHDGAKLK